jgi:hypothetical protein
MFFFERGRPAAAPQLCLFFSKTLPCLFPSVLKRPPSLAKRSGLSERQLDEISRWMALIETHMLEAQQAQQGGASGSTDNKGSVPSPAASPSDIGGGSAAGAPLVPTGSMLLGHLNGSRASLLGGQSGAQTATATATAAAIYRDRRLRVACPCIISAVVAAAWAAPAAGQDGVESVHGTGDGGQLLKDAMGARMSAMAASAARIALERRGRQQVEEAICELMVGSIRPEKNRARRERQERRELEQRRRRVAEARPTIQQAAAAAAARTGVGVRAGGSCKVALQLATSAFATPPCGEAVPSSAEPGSTRLSRSSSDASVAAAIEGTTPLAGSLLEGSFPFNEGCPPCSGSPRCDQDGPPGRVTIDNLTSLLQSASLESTPSEAGALGMETPGAGTAGKAAPGGNVGVGDLADLLVGGKRMDQD